MILNSSGINHHNHIQIHNSCNIDDQYMLHLKHQDSIAIARQKLPEYAKFPLKLKQGQRQAVDSLLQGSDCIAVLPTGYKKSLIFQLFVSAAAIKRDGNERVLVVCTSQSIIEDQIREARN